jgi:hypothetical protein
VKSAYLRTFQSTQLRLRFFRLFQNLWRFGRSYNNKKYSNLDFLPPPFFPDFYSIYIYFPYERNTFWGLFKIKFSVTCGVRLAVALLPCAEPRLASRGGTLLSHARRYKASRPTASCPSAASTLAWLSVPSPPSLACTGRRRSRFPLFLVQVFVTNRAHRRSSRGSLAVAVPPVAAAAVYSERRIGEDPPPSSTALAPLPPLP